MESSEDLKPCPFCGGKAVLETFITLHEKVPRFRVRCTECKCDMGWDWFKAADVVEVWNKRVENLKINAELQDF